ncbi:MAG: hypothetical protein FD123_951 [Bacteroidetes bacterium]|nr:MAG: hypothetical protein FD123_951 [Bacteroidota bacterium]
MASDNLEKKEKIELEIDARDLCNVLAYEYFLKKHIAAGDKIPARVLKKFISFFRITEDERRKGIEKQINILKNRIIERFGADAEYTFERPKAKKRKGNDIVFEIPASSFKDVVNSAVSSLVSTLMENHNKYRNTDERKFLFESIFNSINSVMKGAPKPAQKKISRYKKIVLASFMTSEIGYRFTTKKNPTNQDYFQGAKYIANKMKNKSAK